MTLHTRYAVPHHPSDGSWLSDTVLGTAILPRRPQRSTRSLLTRAMLECGPFLAAFDAGMCDE